MNCCISKDIKRLIREIDLEFDVPPPKRITMSRRTWCYLLRGFPVEGEELAKIVNAQDAEYLGMPCRIIDRPGMWFQISSDSAKVKEATG